MSMHEQRRQARNRRARARRARKKAWEARLKRYDEFAAYMVSLKKIARAEPTLTADQVIARWLERNP